MEVPFVNLPALHDEIGTELRSAIDSVFDSCAFAGGPVVDAFERQFAAYCGTDHCVAVSSGTAALEILLRAYDIGPGDEVMLPANTFVATAEAVALVGARPVFIDVREETANLNPDLLGDAVTDKTKAVIPVHLFGQPAEMTAITDFARANNLIVIEDAAQAHGATFNGQSAGSLADAAAFSFYAAKNLGACGEAGCLTTNDSAIAERARMLRDHGSKQKYLHELLGRNDRIDGLQAAILSVKLPHLDDWNDRRIDLAERYDAAFAGHSVIRPISVHEGCRPVYHLFVVRVPERDRLRAALQEAGIATGIHYPVPLHHQPVFAELGYARGEFPVSERLAGEILSLPMFPHLSPQQVDFVAETLIRLVG